MISIKQYITVIEYLEDTIDLLLINPVRNNIIIGLCLNSIRRTIPQEKILLLNLYHSSKIVLTVLKNQKRALLLGHDYQLEDIIELSKYLINGKIEMEGVLADKELAVKFSKIHYPNFQIEKTLIAHQLGMLKSIQISEGSFEVCTMEDLDIISNWLVNFQIECKLPNFMGQEQTRIDTLKRIENKSLYKWVVGDSIVSICAEAVSNQYFSKISLVYTPQEYRRKNYARSCVWSLTKLIQEGGQKTICLFTDKANPTSNKIYGEIGFEAIGEDLEVLYG